MEAVFRDCQDIEDKFNHPTSLSKSQTELELLCKRIVKSTNLLKELEKKSDCFQYSLPTGFYDTLCVVGEYFSVTASEQLSALAQNESVNRLNPQAQETIRRVIGRTVEKIMRVYRLLPLESLETKDQEYLTYRTNRLKRRSRERSILSQRAMSGSSLSPIALRWLPQVSQLYGQRPPKSHSYLDISARPRARYSSLSRLVRIS